MNRENVVISMDGHTEAFLDLKPWMPKPLHAAFDEAMDVLKGFASSPSFAGLVITEFNSVRDPDGTLAQRLVKAVVGILTAAHPYWENGNSA